MATFPTLFDVRHFLFQELIISMLLPMKRPQVGNTFYSINIAYRIAIAGACKVSIVTVLNITTFLLYLFVCRIFLAVIILIIFAETPDLRAAKNDLATLCYD